MKRGQAFLIAALMMWQAGCVLRGKPKATPAPPPPEPIPVPATSSPSRPAEPLSVPQTQVKLPPEQPLNLEALPPEPQAAPQENPPRQTRANRPRPSAPKPAEPAAPAAAAPATPIPESRPPIEEVVPASEQKRFQDQAQTRKREIRQWLDSAGRRRLNRHQQNTVERIQAFLKDSDDAEARGDMREADALAERAQILLRELQNGQ